MDATSWWVCVCASVHHLNKTPEVSEYIQKVLSGLALCGMFTEMLFYFYIGSSSTTTFQFFSMRQNYTFEYTVL